MKPPIMVLRLKYILNAIYILNVFQVCREMMSLPLLPHEHIAPMFHHLAGRITDETPLLQTLSRYVETQWIDGPTFNCRDWSVYRQRVRTNNDVEGWHYRLNHRGKKASLPFYLLIHLLHRESKVVTRTVQLVFREDLTRQQRRGAANTKKKGRQG